MFVKEETTNLYYFNAGSLEVCYLCCLVLRIMEAQAPEEYRLLGIMLGLALYNNIILDLHFPPVVYKKVND